MAAYGKEQKMPHFSLVGDICMLVLLYIVSVNDILLRLDGQ